VVSLILLILFIASTLEMLKYLVLIMIKLLSNPPKKIILNYVDEIIIVTSVSYFLSYILY